MTSFEYASGLISIVIGLGLARILGGVGAFLRANVRDSTDWIAVTWCVVLGIAMLGWWMIGWQFLRPQPEISGANLFFWTFATALLYLAAYLLIPGIVESHSGADRNVEFELPSRAFFVCLALHFAFLPAYSLVAHGSIADSVGRLNSIGPMGLVFLSLVGMFLKTPRAHAIQLAIWVAVLSVALVGNFDSLGR